MSPSVDIRKLIDRHGVARVTGLKPSYVLAVINRPDFPKAAVIIGRTHFWRPDDIEKWNKRRKAA